MLLHIIMWTVICVHILMLAKLFPCTQQWTLGTTRRYASDNILCKMCAFLYCRLPVASKNTQVTTLPRSATHQASNAVIVAFYARFNFLENNVRGIKTRDCTPLPLSLISSGWILMRKTLSLLYHFSFTINDASCLSCDRGRHELHTRSTRICHRQSTSSRRHRWRFGPCCRHSSVYN